MNRVDPEGLDWYSQQVRAPSTDESGDFITLYKYTTAHSQEELERLGVDGTYLGEAVVLFEGSLNEKIGSDGTMKSDDAIPAAVTIYGINGEDDIQQYVGLSVSSDPSIYPMIEPGEYKMRQQQMSHSTYKDGGYNYLIMTMEGNTKIPPVGGINKATKMHYIEGAFMHRTNFSGLAKYASEGCLVIDGRDWKLVDYQLGESQNIYLKLTR